MPGRTTHTFDGGFYTGFRSFLASKAGIENSGRNYTVSFDVNKGAGSTDINSVASRTGSLTFKSWLINGGEYSAGAEVSSSNFTSEHGKTVDAIAQWDSVTIGDFVTPIRSCYYLNGWDTSG